MALTPYANWAVTDAGNTIPSAAVEVRRVADNSLATLFTDTGGGTGLANPFTANSDGRFDFATEPDRYNVLVGTGGSQVTVPLDLTDGRAQIPFESRAAFVSWVSGGGVSADGTIKSDGTVKYVASSGATDISDLSGWVPFGDVTPNHFGTNSNEGVTDTATFLQGAVDYVESQGGGVVSLLDQVYATTATILIRENGVFLKGQGVNNTIIRMISPNTNCIRFARNDVGDTYLRYAGVSDMSVDNLQSDESSGALIRLERPRDFYLERCRLLGGFTGLEILSGNTVWVRDTLINYLGFTSAPGGDSAGIRMGRLQTTASDPNGVQDPVDSLYYALGFVYFLDNVEVWGGGDFGRNHGILVQQCDGLQVTNSHFGRAQTSQFTIRAAQQNLIVQNINVSNCQLDPAGESLTGNSNYGLLFQPDSLSTRLVRDVNFSNCSILGADIDGVLVNELVSNFSWIGGTIKLAQNWSIRVQEGEASIVGLASRDANEGGGGAGHILFNGGSGTVVGCIGSGGGNVGVSVAPSASVSVAGNRFPDATTDASLSGGVSSVYSDINVRGEISVNGVQVVGAQGATVSDPTGGATVDTQARTAINQLIDRLQAHGLIA